MDKSLFHEQISYLFFPPLFGKTFDDIRQLFLNSWHQFYVRTAAALIFTLLYLLTIICNPFLCQVLMSRALEAQLFVSLFHSSHLST